MNVLTQSELRHEAVQLAEAIVRRGSAMGLTCGCAESCTGGIVSAVITTVPGASAVLRGGIVSYAVDVKRDVLGVDELILNDPCLGPVSSACAIQMSQGAARVLGCDVAVSVTGIAGPGGGEKGKPVGTVWFGVCSPNGAFSEVHHFEGDRDEVRLQAVCVALSLIHDVFMELQP